MEGHGEIWKYQEHTSFVKIGVAVHEAICSGYLAVTKFVIIKQSIV